jgi:hypothetical protein
MRRGAIGMPRISSGRVGTPFMAHRRDLTITGLDITPRTVTAPWPEHSSPSSWRTGACSIFQLLCSRCSTMAPATLSCSSSAPFPQAHEHTQTQIVGFGPHGSTIERTGNAIKAVTLCAPHLRACRNIFAPANVLISTRLI